MQFKDCSYLLNKSFYEEKSFTLVVEYHKIIALYERLCVIIYNLHLKDGY